MRRVLQIVIAIVVLIAGLVFFSASRKERIDAAPSAEVPGATPLPAASAPAVRELPPPSNAHDAQLQRAIADGKLPPGAYRPPVFRALPEGLNGRQLRDIYDSLAKAAAAGDAKAAHTLATLADECTKGLRQIEEIEQKKVTTYSNDPVAHIWLKDQYAVMRVQCPQLTTDERGSASDWMLLAAKGGNRDALLRLAAFEPRIQDPDYEAKKRDWRETLETRLDALAQAGDTDAAMTLAQEFLVERTLANLKSAYRYFDLASKGKGRSSQIEHALKMRDWLASEIARQEKNGS